jgi:S1-C subfamily serine protease
MRPGDEILAIGTDAVRGLDVLRRRVDAFHAGARTILRVRRGENEHTVVIEGRLDGLTLEERGAN